MVIFMAIFPNRKKEKKILLKNPTFVLCLPKLQIQATL